MKLLDILNEQQPEYKNEYKVMYTVLKDKDFSKGTATYKDEADARKFFNDMTKDDEVISARLRKFTGPDSSQDMMGGAMKSLGRSEDIEKYTHPAWLEARQGGKKYDELTDQEKNIRNFLSTPSFISKKKGFTNKDGSDPYWQQEGLEENKIGQLLGARNYKYVGGPTSGKAIVAGPMPDSEKNQLIKKARQAGYVAKPNMGGGVTIFIKEGVEEGVKDKIDAQLMKLLDAVGFDKFADVLIDKFGIDEFPDRLYNAIKKIPAGDKILQKIGDMSALKEDMSKSAIMRQIKDAEEILDSGEANGMPLDNETEMLVQQELTRLKRMLAMNETSLEELYNQVQESRYGFFSNEEGNTASDIMKDALDEYETAVERAFQNLINKTNTAINIEKSGGTDTEVRDNLAYQFDKIQEKVTTEDYLNATFYNFKNK